METEIVRALEAKITTLEQTIQKLEQEKEDLQKDLNANRTSLNQLMTNAKTIEIERDTIISLVQLLVHKAK